MPRDPRLDADRSASGLLRLPPSTPDTTSSLSSPFLLIWICSEVLGLQAWLPEKSGFTLPLLQRGFL